MATLAGQRAQFTWALNQYNLSEDPDTRAKYARRMAKYVAAAPANGFTASQVTTGQSYPAEVDQFVNDPSVIDELGPTEEQAVKTVKETVDTIEIKINKCRALERAIQATLETRGCNHGWRRRMVQSEPG